MCFSGIDQHKVSPVIATVTADGQRIAQVTLPNHRAALLAYFAQFAGPPQAVVESTGRWCWMRDLLVPAGVDLQLAHAKLLKAIAYAQVKTDAVDADSLAQIAVVQRGPRDVLRARLSWSSAGCAASTVAAACVTHVMAPRDSAGRRHIPEDEAASIRRPPGTTTACLTYTGSMELDGGLSPGWRRRHR